LGSISIRLKHLNKLLILRNLSAARALFPQRIIVNRILKPVIFVIAAAYFAVDAVFFAVARPVADWVGKLRILGGLAAWIVSLRPYPTLALFMVPLIAFEPIKPFAAYMLATGHLKVALATLVVGEILKLVILERLFSISRDKLMLIPSFGWIYRKFCQIRNRLEATETWQAARHWSKVAQNAVRKYVAHTLVVRMDTSNTNIRDSFLVPTPCLSPTRIVRGSAYPIARLPDFDMIDPMQGCSHRVLDRTQG
jgi:hypothetical protein